MLLAVVLDLLKGREGSRAPSPGCLFPVWFNCQGDWLPVRSEDDVSCLLSSVFLSVFPQFVLINFPSAPQADSCGLLAVGAWSECLRESIDRLLSSTGLAHQASTWAHCTAGHSPHAVPLLSLRTQLQQAASQAFSQLWFPPLR